jgi:crotonobetainyl-CoA:carnitine CoA-transferase CaiB-like acyl-CoA transferase
MVITVEHPRAGTIRTQGSPMRLDGVPARAASPAPVLGQHSREVLAMAGLAPNEVETMIATGAVLG